MSRLHSKWANTSSVSIARRAPSFALGVVSLCALVVAVFVLPAAVVSASAACEGNEGRRVEQGSTFLPDCRAFELVTPPHKDSGEPKAVIPGLRAYYLNGIPGAHASLTGERMAWISEYDLPVSSSTGADYLSTRGAGSWSSEDVIPPQSVENGTGCPFTTTMVAYSSDLSRGVLADGFGQPGSFKGEGTSCGHDEPRLVLGEPETFQNLFVRNNDTSSYQLVNVTPPNTPPPLKPANAGEQYFPAGFLAGSSDLSHVVFEEELPLTPEAPAGVEDDDLYEWSSGVVRLVSILPDGAPVVGRLAGSTRNAGLEEVSGQVVPFNIANYRHAVSGDGSLVFFVAEGNLYVREHADREQSALDGGGHCIEPEKACTVQVDASQVSGHSGGGGKFMVASENGSKVFFTDEASAGLTSDTVAGSGQNLYEFDVESGTLADLTPVGDARLDGVSGASDDGSYIYFVAEGALASNTTAGHDAIVGQPNLYVDHAGVLTFIATLDPSSDSCDWMSQGCIDFPLLGGLSARVSGNGAFIGFNSDSSLTGYDNKGSACVPQLLSGEVNVATFTPGACEEIFLYDVTTNKLSCASCDQSGASPAGPAMIRFPAIPRSSEMRNAYPQRNISESGQVFFETMTPLVPAATNGKYDVYEYENGQQYLLSDGTGEADSYFLDASTDGSNVFFASAQRLIPRDSDSAYDIYDARVGGGFLEPHPNSPCEGEGCSAAVAGAPVFATPSSVTFNGPGNITQPPVTTQPVVKAKSKSKSVRCKKGHVKRKGKCVKQTKARVKKSAKGRK